MMVDGESTEVKVREYRSSDEDEWVKCRLLSFLDTAYFDDIHREKQAYENPSIELVADSDGRIIGLIDVELDTVTHQVCSEEDELSAMIWHLAVHPDYQRRGIASELLEVIVSIGGDDIERLEAWTRDDGGTVKWYESNGFTLGDTYIHVYLDREEAKKDVDYISRRVICQFCVRSIRWR